MVKSIHWDPIDMIRQDINADGKMKEKTVCLPGSKLSPNFPAKMVSERPDTILHCQRG